MISLTKGLVIIALKETALMNIALKVIALT